MLVNLMNVVRRYLFHELEDFSNYSPLISTSMALLLCVVDISLHSTHFINMCFLTKFL